METVIAGGQRNLPAPPAQTCRALGEVEGKRQLPREQGPPRGQSHSPGCGPLFPSPSPEAPQDEGESEDVLSRRWERVLPRAEESQTPWQTLGLRTVPGACGLTAPPAVTQPAAAATATEDVKLEPPAV